MSTVFIDQDIEFNKNKVNCLDGIYFDREPTLPNELSIKKDIENESDKNAILRFKQTLQNYHKVSVGNDVYDITKKSKQKFIDTKVMSSTQVKRIFITSKENEVFVDDTNHKIHLSEKLSKENEVFVDDTNHKFYFVDEKR